VLESFEFKDESSGWTLPPVHFTQVNLLVGVSGVGKSRILSALTASAMAGSTSWTRLAHGSWKLTVVAGGQRHIWSVSVEPSEERYTGPHENGDEEGVIYIGSGREPIRPRFVTETISLEDGEVIAERSKAGITFLGNAAPRLKESESLLSLFRKEESIAPLFQELSRVFPSTVEDFEIPFWTRERTAKFAKDIDSLTKLRQAVRVPLLVRLYLLQTLAKDEFNAIVSSFRDIFESVIDVRLDFPSQLGLNLDDFESEALTLVVGEEGVRSPVPLGMLSSGMRRTLRHLAELALAPEGSTILIDEYENSMAVNCLPSVTKHLLNHTREIQIIVISHHPYVINNIALEHWRLVTRSGSTVRVVDAKDLPELRSASRQDAFIRLLNSASYRDGVAP